MVCGVVVVVCVVVKGSGKCNRCGGGVGNKNGNQSGGGVVGKERPKTQRNEPERV